MHFIFIINQYQGAARTLATPLPNILSLRHHCLILVEECFLKANAITACNSVLSMYFSGSTLDEDLFHEAIHNHVPNGCTFKGYPMQCACINAQKIFHSALRYVNFLWS